MSNPSEFSFEDPNFSKQFQLVCDDAKKTWRDFLEWHRKFLQSRSPTSTLTKRHFEGVVASEIFNPSGPYGSTYAAIFSAFATRSITVSTSAPIKFEMASRGVGYPGGLSWIFAKSENKLVAHFNDKVVDPKTSTGKEIATRLLLHETAHVRFHWPQLYSGSGNSYAKPANAEADCCGWWWAATILTLVAGAYSENKRTGATTYNLDNTGSKL